MTVVIGLDGSDASRRAFHEAVRQAEWRGCPLLVVHVTANPAYYGDVGLGIDIDTVREAGRSRAEELVAELTGTYDRGVPVEIEVQALTGHTGMELIRAAEEADADLVVLGSRGLGGFRGLLLGSVTTYAAHHLTCQLLIVPAE